MQVGVRYPISIPNRRIGIDLAKNEGAVQEVEMATSPTSSSCCSSEGAVSDSEDGGEWWSYKQGAEFLQELCVSHQAKTFLRDTNASVVMRKAEDHSPKTLYPSNYKEAYVNLKSSEVISTRFFFSYMAFFSLQFCLDTYYEISNKSELSEHEVEIQRRLELGIKYRLSSKISEKIISSEFLWSNSLLEVFPNLNELKEQFNFEERNDPFGLFVYKYGARNKSTSSYCLININDTERLLSRRKLNKADLQCIVFRNNNLAAFPVVSSLAEKLVDVPVYLTRLLSGSQQFSEVIALLMAKELLGEPQRGIFGFTDKDIQDIFKDDSLEEVMFLLQSSFYESVKQPYRNRVGLSSKDRRDFISFFDNRKTTLLFSSLQKLLTLHPNLRGYFARHKQDKVRFFLGGGPFSIAPKTGDYLLYPIEGDGQEFYQLFYIANLEKNTLLGTNRTMQLSGEEDERKFDTILPLREKLNQLAKKVQMEGQQSFLELPTSEVTKIIPFQSSIEDLLCELSGRFEVANIFNDVYNIATSSLEFSDFLIKLKANFELGSAKLKELEFDEFEESGLLLWHICNFVKSLGLKISEFVPQEKLKEFKLSESVKFPDLFKTHSRKEGYVYALLIGIFFHMASDDFLGTAADSSSLFFRLLALFSGVALENHVLDVIERANPPKPEESEIKEMREYFYSFYSSGLSLVCATTISELYLAHVAPISRDIETGKLFSAVFKLLNLKISKPNDTPFPSI